MCKGRAGRSVLLLQNTALIQEFSIALVGSQVQNNYKEDRHLLKMLPAGQNIQNLSAENISSACGYGFYGDGTQVQITTETIFVCTLEWLLISKSLRYKPSSPQLDIHTSSVHPGKCVILACTLLDRWKQNSSPSTKVTVCKFC